MHFFSSLLLVKGDGRIFFNAEDCSNLDTRLSGCLKPRSVGGFRLLGVGREANKVGKAVFLSLFFPFTTSNSDASKWSCNIEWTKLNDFNHSASKMSPISFSDLCTNLFPTQEEQLYRLHEETEFTEEEFQQYKNEKVPLHLANSLHSNLRSGK